MAKRKRLPVVDVRGVAASLAAAVAGMLDHDDDCEPPLCRHVNQHEMTALIAENLEIHVADGDIRAPSVDVDAPSLNERITAATTELVEAIYPHGQRATASLAMEAVLRRHLMPVVEPEFYSPPDPPERWYPDDDPATVVPTADGMAGSVWLFGAVRVVTTTDVEQAFGLCDLLNEQGREWARAAANRNRETEDKLNMASGRIRELEEERDMLLAQASTALEQINGLIRLADERRDRIAELEMRVTELLTANTREVETRRKFQQESERLSANLGVAWADGSRLRDRVIRLGHDLAKAGRKIHNQRQTIKAMRLPLADPLRSAACLRDILAWARKPYTDFFGREESEELMPIFQRHGFAERVAYDPDKHGAEMDDGAYDPGDMIWQFTVKKEE